MTYREFATVASGALLAGFALGRWTHTSPWVFLGMAIGYGVSLVVEIVQKRRRGGK